ncbi:MAG: hydrogenase iron-sulfur subunit [Dehalococcoidia bacterium]|nr:hydrogenase iron-sulfur subunit [Dehalococcoidia bacterium]
MVEILDTELTPGAARAATASAGENGWEPRIAAFICNWCTYAGADMAGTSRREYAPNVRNVRFLCTGRMDPLFILKAFEQGADGVLLSGCHPGDCHYVQGNMLARRRFTVFEALMDFLGLDQRRLQFAWVSASEGVKWAQIVDGATDAVREAGPLENWGDANETDLAAFRELFPEPEPEPRAKPTTEETEKITGHVRETASKLLGEGDTRLFLGFTEGSLPGQMVPAFVTDADATDTLMWNENCANNLTVYLHDAVKQAGEGKIAIVLKSCDVKGVIGLLRENQVSREDLTLIGVSCTGVWNEGKMSAKCFACADELSPLIDLTISADGVVEGAVSTDAERQTAADPRGAEIAALEAATPEVRWDFWQNQFERCLRCYACRAVCTLCYCETCIVDKHRPQWISKSFDGKGNTAWNVTRAMHLAGRCTGCDECTRACPADIRLDLLNLRIANEIETRFDFHDIDDPNSQPPLTAFSPDDPDNFL